MSVDMFRMTANYVRKKTRWDRWMGLDREAPRVYLLFRMRGRCTQCAGLVARMMERMDHMCSYSIMLEGWSSGRENRTSSAAGKTATLTPHTIWNTRITLVTPQQYTHVQHMPKYQHSTKKPQPCISKPKTKTIKFAHSIEVNTRMASGKTSLNAGSHSLKFATPRWVFGQIGTHKNTHIKL